MAAADELMRRLIALDNLLAGEGLHRPSFAKQWGVSEKAIMRDLETVRSLGLETKIVMEGEAGAGGNRYLHFYADRRKRIFSKWMSGGGDLGKGG